jgi:nitrogen-specific signal transduction histidine kinase
MVGTTVRYSRERLDSFIGAMTRREASSLWTPRTITLRTLCLTAFLTIQSVHVVLLAQSQRVELELMACVLAAGLLAYAFYDQAARARTCERSSFAAMPANSASAQVAVTAPLVDVNVTALTTSASQSEFNGPIAPHASLSCQHDTWTDLMGRISHEIRTPLNAVIGFSELMSREMFGPLGHQHYGDYVSHIKESSHAVLKSAEDTLALSSLLAAADNTQRPQASSLNGLLEDAWTFLEPQATRRGICLERLIDVPVDIVGDRLCYRQVILNLLSEALARCEDNQTIVFRALAFSERVRVSVTVVAAKPTPRSLLPSLALSVARALLERQGATLVTSTCPQGQWHAMTVLDTAVQSDFFGQARQVERVSVGASGCGS